MTKYDIYLIDGCTKERTLSHTGDFTNERAAHLFARLLVEDKERLWLSRRSFAFEVVEKRKTWKRYKARVKTNPKETFRWYYYRKDILPPVGVERDTTAWFDWIWGNIENQEKTGRNLEGVFVIVQEHGGKFFKNSYRYIGLVYEQAGKFGDYIHKDDVDIIECLGEYDGLNRKVK